jgi:hypothetical protein
LQSCATVTSIEKFNYTEVLQGQYPLSSFCLSNYPVKTVCCVGDTVFIRGKSNSGTQGAIVRAKKQTNQ